MADEQRSAKTDGCTGVPDVAWHCCALHDMRYRGLRRDVADRAEADRLFRECLRDRGREDEPFWRWTFWEPLAWAWWAGVRLFGARAWRQQRPFLRRSR